VRPKNPSREKVTIQSFCTQKSQNSQKRTRYTRAYRPDGSKFRARERESNKFELSLRAQPKLNNKIVKGVATCHIRAISAISVQKKTHHTRIIHYRPQISL
jgi:hypothetical protein